MFYRFALQSQTVWKGTGACFSKVPKSFRALKAIRKTPTCLFCKARLFICNSCKGNKNNCKVSCLETPLFWRYKENYVIRKAPEKFRDFRETGSWFWVIRFREERNLTSNVSTTFYATGYSTRKKYITSLLTWHHSLEKHRWSFEWYNLLSRHRFETYRIQNWNIRVVT